MDTVYRCVSGVGRAGLRALGVRVRALGAEHLPRSGPALLAANHVSYPDFVLVEKAALERDRLVRFMCRHDVWVRPLVAGAMDRMQHIPVDRQVPAAAYLQARRLLREGEAVCAFPEAGISHSFTIRPLMRGVAALAAETGVPIVPVTVWGGQRLWTVGDRPPDLTRGRLVDIWFGEPVPPGADTTATMHALGARLAAMLEELQLRPEHRPRPGEYAPWYPAHLGGHAPTRLEAERLDSVPSSAVRPSWAGG